eukprot:CAMPEP_0205801744 /NCGR_PEP_ID=MMETSP0205-20121125/3832_1 /ASSEMBLY_ACC=CAM_ASM_000278 /TAXON_ID=36767 /ORGANISM="Euplotes focardii, Strain TN1" /LENGTH=38 /DNA_ID= /DNA_START= /DNA_END= /DNA_ORIENTATION=
MPDMEHIKDSVTGFSGSEPCGMDDSDIRLYSSWSEDSS